MRQNASFLNRVSFRRRTPTRGISPTTVPNNTSPNSNIESISPAAANVVRSCIDIFSETASITPPASIILGHEGSLSGKIYLEILKLKKTYFIR
jgi:hypothetical protein